MHGNRSELAKAEARRWLKDAVAKEREQLQVVAFEAGMRLGGAGAGVRAVDGVIEGWWPELAPLSREERELVRVSVARALVDAASKRAGGALVAVDEAAGLEEAGALAAALPGEDDAGEAPAPQRLRRALEA